MTGSAAVFNGRKILLSIIVLAVAGGIGFLNYQRRSKIETDLFVPIETDIDSRSITVITPQSGGVNIRIRGPAKSISRLSRNPVRIRLDNIKAGNGIQTLPIDRLKIRLPSDVSVVNIRPETVTVRIEPLIEKSLPLVIELRGKPAAGFTLAERIVKPETVRVRGPESVVSAQTGIRIKPVDIGGVSESFEKRVVPDLPDPLKRVGTEPFILKLDVREKIVSTRLAGIPIEGRGTAQIFEISPPSLTLTVKGPFQQIQRLRENPDFAVYVDLTGLGPGVYVRRAVILLPVDIVLTKTDPELFTIRIKK